MKNGLLAWNVVLTLVAGYLLYLHFSSNTSVAKKNTQEIKEDAPGQSNFRIAYFELDSVENSYNMVKDVKAETSKRDEEYSGILAKLENSYRNKIMDYQQRMRSGTMTAADDEKAQIDIKRVEDNLRSTKQDLESKYQDFVMRKNLTIKKSIEDYLAEFNKNGKYSYIFAYEQGLFYYKDTAYNITADLIKGLNDRYKPAKN